MECTVRVVCALQLIAYFGSPSSRGTARVPVSRNRAPGYAERTRGEATVCSLPPFSFPPSCPCTRSAAAVDVVDVAPAALLIDSRERLIIGLLPPPGLSLPAVVYDPPPSSSPVSQIDAERDQDFARTSTRLCRVAMLNYRPRPHATIPCVSPDPPFCVRQFSVLHTAAGIFP
ncbi:hypothetical protein C8R45DRAFT_543740 [Mycena sanguinolenta]|nr:hypothetical protein C8R45DRAFT_543740 [Mycena sanguinolenta]